MWDEIAHPTLAIAYLRNVVGLSRWLTIVRRRSTLSATSHTLL